ncbi:hypothetical protein [Arthrobacter sp. SX1312]|uniref:hypothetical protein n=1 Tax=Arthrobacter sp. SX1312 TaxID=2058896 RepID=UPI000CE45413|nr:hypothetical protein [Arthrobacter sp. SX1312]
MRSRLSVKWVKAGLVTLPAYGLLTAWSSIKAQPDQTTDPEAWAQFVTSPSYLASHLIGSTGGTILAIFGVFALGCYLAPASTGRLALPAMVVTVLGHALLMVPAVISTFATPALGRAYLSGMPDVMQVEFPDALTGTFLLGLLLALVGNLLLGVAIWRSGTLPKGAGGLWIVSALIFYVLGVVLGLATTGATLPTQPLGALLVAGAGAWIAGSAFRRDSAAGAARDYGRGSTGDTSHGSFLP